MLTDNKELHQRRQYALKYCQESIDWYEKKKLTDRLLYQSMLVIAIVLSASTPLLILLTNTKLVQAIVATLACIATGMNAAFQWNDSYARFAYASETLKAERLKFETGEYRTTDDESKAIEDFVDKISEIVVNETSEWRKQEEQADQPAAPTHPSG